VNPLAPWSVQNHTGSCKRSRRPLDLPDFRVFLAGWPTKKLNAWLPFRARVGVVANRAATC
jgi:hypothetical protein